MRTALVAAMHALLSDPRLDGALDVVRLAAVVLLAKAPATGSGVLVTYRDLAGWLGCSVSHVGHTVIPELRAAGVITSKPKRDPLTGHSEGVVLDLIPLREARETGGVHPLALLNQRDLATLLHLCEAVTCPGWTPKDKPETPAGFMTERRGPDAATDRLAMLLLVLEARDNGRVRMAPGRVAEGFGRADATVARMLGCEVTDAVPVVDRLVGMEAAEFERGGRDRLRVPAVAEAWMRARKATSGPSTPPNPASDFGVEPTVQEPAPCPRCTHNATDSEGQGLVLAGDGWAQESFDDVLMGQPESAFGDQDLSEFGSPQVRATFDGACADERAARFHATHSPVADLSEVGAGDSDCFSGSAVSGCDDQRGRVRAREDQPEGSSTSEGFLGTRNRPLRGEEHEKRRSSRKSSFVGVVAVPEDLREALAPLSYLWAGLGRVSTGRYLAQAVRRELGRLRGIVGQEHAQQALARRLRRRLDRQGARPVQDFAGWLLERGLPQAQGCWSTMCDDGARMDTGGPCGGCGRLVGDRRGMRRTVAVEVAARYPQRPPEARRPLYEQELQARFEQQVADQLVRHEQAARSREQLERHVQEQKNLLQQQAAERAASPCRRCGTPQAAGVCPRCAHTTQTRKVVGEAVDIVLALRADLGDREAVAVLAEQVERDTWTVVRKVGSDIEAGEQVVRDHIEYQRAGRLLAQRRRKALESLGAMPAAVAEAERVQRMALRRAWPSIGPAPDEAKSDAELAGAKARARVAQELLVSRLSEVRRSRATVQPSRRPWSERLAELAERYDSAAPEPVGAP
ncbi:hypothetical protein [Streptomyces decoyicus]|uniref:hypothetical protein n=1 Tax=Streptomyces decoyicus TaxID=249567 RepID=UPI0036521A5B